MLFISHRDKSQFVAEVATVSDEGIENEMPLNVFHVELYRRINKAGLRCNSFTYSVGEHPFGVGDAKTRLMLPRRGEFDREIFNSRFKAFLNYIKQNPDRRHNHQILTDNTNILIEYSPAQKFASATYPVHTLATSKTQNCVYNALRYKTQNQFRRVSYSGPKGIILCDGGSKMFHTRPSEKFHPYYNAREVAGEFLRQNRSINFVLLLSIIDAKNGFLFKTKPPYRKVQAELITDKSFTNLPTGLGEALAEIERQFPEPCNSAAGARETIRHGYDPIKIRTLMGKIVMSNQQIKVSSNDILALLAGVITQEELFKSWDNTISTRSAFHYFLSKKMRIVEVQVIDQGDVSNLIFKFDGPDAAISPFINPKTEKVTPRRKSDSDTL